MGALWFCSEMLLAPRGGRSILVTGALWFCSEMLLAPLAPTGLRKRRGRRKVPHAREAPPGQISYLRMDHLFPVAEDPVSPSPRPSGSWEPTVVVTRPETRADTLAGPLRALGLRVVLFPTLRVVPPPDERPLDEAASRLDSYVWIVFTSPNGVRALAGRLPALPTTEAGEGGRVSPRWGPGPRRRCATCWAATWT
jgi:hypothetical protein